MAENLRAKIPERDKLVICDRNTKVTAKFMREVGTAVSVVGMDGEGNGIEVLNSPREVAEKSVSENLPPFF